MSSSKKTILIILDGWGHGNKKKSDAIHHASTPFIDSLYEKYPNSELRTDGVHVGLPSGQMGNSEVGHLNIGAGRLLALLVAPCTLNIDMFRLGIVWLWMMKHIRLRLHRRL